MRAEAGDIKAQIVVFFGDFDGNRAAVFTGKFAAAGEAFIGPFKSFHGEYSAIFNDDSLSDLEAGSFFGNTKAKVDVIPLIVREFPTELKVFFGHEWLKPGSSFD